MLECPKCKKQQPDGMNFCDNCGTPLVSATPQQDTSSGTISSGTISSGTISSGTISSGTVNTGTIPQQQPQQFQPQPQQFQQSQQYQQQPQQFQQQSQQFQQAPQQFQQQPQQYQQAPQQFRAQPQPQWGGQPQQQWGAPATKKKSKTGLIVGIIIVVVLIVTAAILIITGIIPVPIGNSAQNKLKNATVGATVIFGKYEQDANNGNGKEDIEWTVLEKKDDMILLISNKALDGKSFNSQTAAVSWETCSLRQFCNNEFFSGAFDDNEQKLIMQTTVNADKNPQKTTSAQGNNTQDKVFILSAVEIAKYFTTNEGRQCYLTDEAKKTGAYIGDNGQAVCWLRTMGTIDSSNKNATIVQAAGSIGYNGRPVAEVQAVRPAIWVSIK